MQSGDYTGHRLDLAIAETADDMAAPSSNPAPNELCRSSGHPSSCLGVGKVFRIQGRRRPSGRPAATTHAVVVLVDRHSGAVSNQASTWALAQ